MKLRAAITVALAVLVAALVVRVALVEAFVTRDPDKAAAIWPGHPDVVLAAGLGEVGVDAAAGRPVDAALVGHMLAAGTQSPLAPEPFLVRGVDAQLAGREQLAGQAFLEARRRDPRSVAARYFLADHYLRTGQIAAGLAEISTLTGLVPRSVGQVAPYLAAYARSPGGAEQVKALIRRNPKLEPVLLSALSTDARDAGLALSLWSGRGDSGARRWQERMLNTLVRAGRFGEARDAWLRFTHSPVGSRELVDSQFRPDGLPPFAWAFASGRGGVAEPQGEGRLHAIFYGRDHAVLASQLLMLEPGRYRLTMRISGASPSADSLSWSIRCVPSPVIAEKNAGRSGALALDFTVPIGCAAQNLELNGRPTDIPEQAELTISELRLEAVR